MSEVHLLNPNRKPTGSAAAAGELLRDAQDGGLVACIPYRFRANMAHKSQSRPEFGLGFQVKVLNLFRLFPLHSVAVVPYGETVARLHVQRTLTTRRQTHRECCGCWRTTSKCPRWWLRRSSRFTKTSSTTPRRYRGSSLVRKHQFLEPLSRPIPRVFWRSRSSRFTKSSSTTPRRCAFSGLEGG